MTYLEIDGERIDREKSASYFRHLARAASKIEIREMLNDQKEIAIKTLRQLDGANEKHSSILLNAKIKSLFEKLDRYAKTVKGRKNRIRELEEKVRQTTLSKEAKIELLRKDVARLEALYRELKNNAPKEQISLLFDRINTLKKDLNR